MKFAEKLYYFHDFSAEYKKFDFHAQRFILADVETFHVFAKESVVYFS
jgi:hypothetical protein